MAPNMLPWSVRAIAGMPASTAALITSSRRLAPSRRLNWLWRWRWTKSDIAVNLAYRDVTRIGASSFRPLRLRLQPADPEDVVEPRGQGEDGDQIERPCRDLLQPVQVGQGAGEEDEDHRHDLEGGVDLAEDRGREPAHSRREVEHQRHGDEQHVAGDDQDGHPEGDGGAVGEARNGEHHVGADQQELVGDRVEIGAEQRLLAPEAGDEA